MVKGAKKPKQMSAAQPQQSKPFADPRGFFPEAHSSQDRLCWRFRHIDHEGPWGMSCMEQGELAALLRALCSFETMQINEIFHGANHRGKTYDVETLPEADAHERLEVLGLSDVTKIWALRLQGKVRVWGFLVGNVFHVVWFDLDHLVWPSTLKHT